MAFHYRHVVARIAPDAISELNKRIGSQNARFYKGLVAWDAEAGIATGDSGSRRAFDPRDVEKATGWHVEFNAAGARLVKVGFADGSKFSTFAPSWLDRCEPR